MPKRTFIVAVLLLSIYPVTIAAQAGAPLLTQSPGTPKQGHWSNKLSINLDDRGTQKIWKLPQMDISYGITNHLQLQAKLPWVLSRASSHAMSIYPQLELNNPTNSVKRGLASDGWQLLMPVQMTVRTGPIRLTADLGYRVGKVSPDAYSYGFAGNVKPTSRLELLGEFHDVASHRLMERDPVIAGGARVKFTERTLLLASYGRRVGESLARGRGAVVYFGLQTDK